MVNLRYVKHVNGLEGKILGMGQEYKVMEFNILSCAS